MELPKGVRDFAPEEKILRDKVIKTLTNVFERYGFDPLETPIIEKWETLTAKFGSAADEQDVMKEVYKFSDQGGRELGLRFELTLSTARFVGMNPQLKMPFKRYQIGQVFRDGPIKLGRYREFTQCDIDTFGSANMTADAEIISLLLTAFNDLELDVTLQVNNRKLLNSLIKAAGIDASKAESVMISIDKLEKQGVDDVRKELEGKGITEDAIAKLLGFFQVAGSNQEKLDTLSDFLQDKEGLTELQELLSYLPEDAPVVITPSLARGLAYYTGTVVEGFLNNSEITGSVCGGGRYDKMVGVLLGNERDVPAVGVAFGLEPITEHLKIQAKGQQGGMPKTVVQAFVIPIKCYLEALGIMDSMRKAGIATGIDLQSRGISKNLEYANSLDIPYVVIVGRRELEEGKVKLKDMRTGDEEMLSIEELIKRF